MTQVIAPDEGHVVHNRLTHVFEVAQVGRRLAERIVREYESEVLDAIGGVNPEIVETAALAHDLGHPPFGHIAEEELDRLMKDAGVDDGFEGNAQSFRVVNSLAVRTHKYDGLDLSRASLAAILKYPWFRETSGKRKKKYGAYHCEDDDFQFAREGLDPNRQSAEATLMDIADDIAYSLSDLEDFVRIGRIPLSNLRYDETERRQFLERAQKAPGIESKYSSETVNSTFVAILGMIPIDSAFSGTDRERANLRHVTGGFMDTFVRSVSLNPSPAAQAPYFSVPEDIRLRIELLKQLTWQYVICHPALAIRQEGQRSIIRGLFEIFCAAADSKHEPERRFIPIPLKARLLRFSGDSTDDIEARRRAVCDFIATMSDREAADYYTKLKGLSRSSIF